jgi:hypothetical protein
MVRPPKTYQAPCPLGRLGVPCFSLYRLTVFHFPDRLLGACRENLGARDGQNIHKQLYLYV